MASMRRFPAGVRTVWKDLGKQLEAKLIGRSDPAHRRREWERPGKPEEWQREGQTEPSWGG
ncbi:hypothetical protein PSCICN_37400 [Pseudomonas cichorii]|nr:hypothetical protein PSCICN_37400 [Pseudomonas cichorii]